MEENSLVVELWNSVAGQWVYTPSGYRSALQSGAVELPLRLLADRYPKLDQLRLLADIQTLAAVIGELHNRQMAKIQKG